jgi:hypothetical protein
MKSYVSREKKIGDLLYEYVIEGFKASGDGIAVIKSTFLMLLRDYFNKNINDQTLETFAGNILYYVSSPKKLKKIDKDLAEALESASDLVYYAQENLTEETYFQTSVKNLRKYYQANS